MPITRRARTLTEEAGLTHLVDFLDCDFLQVDAPDNSFDAIFAIEATCLAPDKPSIYGEAFRLLKPGARFGAYEYCMTDRFDTHNPLRLRLKADIELGGGLLNIDGRETVDNSLRSVGFEVLERLHIAPKGGVRVAETLNLCAAAMAEAGRLGIFTPMYFIHARKPE